jgi:hypothetical protein
MSICFYRNCGCGLCSHIVVICVSMARLNPNYPTCFLFDMSGYGCNWSDLFDQYISDKDCQNKIEIMPIYFQDPYHDQQNYPLEMIKAWNLAYTKHIKPKPDILQRVSELCQQYDIENSTCVYFRGTDKSAEVSRVQYSKYLEHIPAGNDPLWIQSDELGFILFMKSIYPNRAFSVSEFTYSNDQTPIHATNNTTTQNAIEILIIIYMMSRAKKLIANISNVTQSALIIRGSNDYYVPVC